MFFEFIGQPWQESKTTIKRKGSCTPRTSWSSHLSETTIYYVVVVVNGEQTEPEIPREVWEELKVGATVTIKWRPSRFKRIGRPFQAKLIYDFKPVF